MASKALVNENILHLPYKFDSNSHEFGDGDSVDFDFVCELTLSTTNIWEGEGGGFT